MKIGDYVRTRAGYIGEIININEFREPSMKYGIEFQGVDDIIFIGDEHITKLSSNIIGLVEVGDYVNGHKVRTVYLEGATQYIKLEPRDEKGTRIYNEDIKSIVTKEQFESMKYKVGE